MMCSRITWRNSRACDFVAKCGVSSVSCSSPVNPDTNYDAIIVGSGHNGLTCAAYLQNAGWKTCVLERRSKIGGATISEEIVPGFIFSRASYVLSLLRPCVANELQLKKYGLHVHLRDPSSYTPLRKEYQQPGGPKSLTLSSDMKFNIEQIAKFSEKDAKSYGEYNAMLDRCVTALDPLLDVPPPTRTDRSLRGRIELLKQMKPLIKAGIGVSGDIGELYQLLTAPCAHFLGRWFASEPLKATLLTDSVIGAMVGPSTPGTGYNLLHHVSGEIDGVKGAWGYPRGGMGAVSRAIYNALVDKGGHVFTDKPVKRVCVSDSAVTGVELDGGQQLSAPLVLSSATPAVTFLQLLEAEQLPAEYRSAVENISYSSPVCKINVALSRLPNFEADPNTSETSAMPHHRCSIHLNCESIEVIEAAYTEASRGKTSSRPLIEMTLPSVLDDSLAPPGKHVCSLFTQYCPYMPIDGSWNDHSRQKYAEKVFENIEAYAPGFRDSVIDKEVLTPPDLERTFGLTGGNIFHGALSLHQLFTARPTSLLPGPRTPITGLYLCGSGSHPGGGVSGAPGRIAAHVAIKDSGKLRRK